MADETFDAAWLSLRQRADHGARSRTLVHALRLEGRRRGWSHLLDLGAGTGSNLRYISNRVPWAKEWVLVDHDDDLLAKVRAPTHTVRVRTVTGDLDVEGLAEVDEADVVTASALLDLVSESWLTSLRDRCATTGKAAYFALSYDGTVEWHRTSSDAMDALVADAVNEHQRRDKGTGAALGPTATDVARRLFEEAGYRVTVAPSPWTLRAPRDVLLVDALVAGWVEAAAEVRPDAADAIRGWGEAAVRRVRDEGAVVRVGHLDMLALPPDPAAL